MKLGIVVGLAAEAQLARGLSPYVEAGGGGAEGANAATARLVAQGVDALLSFGLAGGLAPGLAAGELVLAEAVIAPDKTVWPTACELTARFGTPSGSMLAAEAILVTAASKHGAWIATGAVAADLESGAVACVAARHGLPFAVLRAVCDPAQRNLPPAALTALDENGHISSAALVRSLARHPSQIPDLIALGREAARARRSLLNRVKEIGPIG